MYALNNEAAKEESFGGWRKKNTDDKMVSAIIQHVLFWYLTQNYANSYLISL